MKFAERHPRDLAVRVLTAVLSDRKPLDEALEAHSQPESRAWLQETCTGTLRWKGRLDFILDSIALKKKPSGWLRKCLLIATYQLLVQEGTAAGAVVSETVDSIKKKEGEAPAKFANATLRKVTEHIADWRKLSAATAEKGKEAELASLPDWLWKKLEKQRGREWAAAFSQATLERPKLWLRSKRSDWNPGWAKPGPLPSSWESTEGGALVTKEGFAEGEFIVQDLSSQKLVGGVVAATRRHFGSRAVSVLDLCAAPGGKSVGLAWEGLRVTATDLSASRRMLLAETIQRTGAAVEVMAFPEDGVIPGGFDLIWLDAPCTGIGIIRRHPDIKWIKEEKDVPSLSKIQRDLVTRAWAALAPGGVLVYSVCSVLDEEGPIAWKAIREEAAEPIEWRLAPQDELGGDGFYGVFLVKKQ